MERTNLLTWPDETITPVSLSGASANDEMPDDLGGAVFAFVLRTPDTLDAGIVAMLIPTITLSASLAAFTSTIASFLNLDSYSLTLGVGEKSLAAMSDAGLIIETD